MTNTIYQVCTLPTDPPKVSAERRGNVRLLTSWVRRLAFCSRHFARENRHNEKCGAYFRSHRMSCGSWIQPLYLDLDTLFLQKPLEHNLILLSTEASSDLHFHNLPIYSNMEQTGKSDTSSYRRLQVLSNEVFLVAKDICL